MWLWKLKDEGRFVLIKDSGCGNDVTGGFFDQFPAKLCIIDTTQVESAPLWLLRLTEFAHRALGVVALSDLLFKQIFKWASQCLLCQNCQHDCLHIFRGKIKINNQTNSVWICVRMCKSVDFLVVIMWFSPFTKSHPDLCCLHPHRCFQNVKGSVDASIQKICLNGDFGF